MKMAELWESDWEGQGKSPGENNMQAGGGKEIGKEKISFGEKKLHKEGYHNWTNQAEDLFAKAERMHVTLEGRKVIIKEVFGMDRESPTFGGPTEETVYQVLGSIGGGGISVTGSAKETGGRSGMSDRDCWGGGKPMRLAKRLLFRGKGGGGEGYGESQGRPDLTELNYFRARCSWMSCLFGGMGGPTRTARGGGQGGVTKYGWG